VYLLLKADQPAEEDSSLIQSHPVMGRLQKLNALSQQLQKRVEDQVPGLSVQLTNLVKAAALMNSDEVDESDSDRDEVSQNTDDEVDAEMTKEQVSQIDVDSDDHDSNSAAEEHRVLNEARFGLRTAEIASRGVNKKRRTPVSLDIGDDAGSDDHAQRATRSLTSTLNTIEQKTSTRQRRTAVSAEQIDDAQDSDGEVRAGLAMMEDELGKDFDGDIDTYDPEDDDGGFYAKVSQKSKSHKEFKKTEYAVAPKFPRVEKEIEGERALSKVILKNRGLVPHKSKINRNPRTKKRKQYRDKLIQRNGAVRTVRTEEGHKYGGEQTGIKSGISRSRKLAR
jgi:U3 small nucleolar RNA-associated protein 3